VEFKDELKKTIDENDKISDKYKEQYLEVMIAISETVPNSKDKMLESVKAITVKKVPVLKMLGGTFSGYDENTNTLYTMDNKRMLMHEAYHQIDNEKIDDKHFKIGCKVVSNKKENISFRTNKTFLYTIFGISALTAPFPALAAMPVVHGILGTSIVGMFTGLTAINYALDNSTVMREGLAEYYTKKTMKKCFDEDVKYIAAYRNVAPLIEKLASVYGEEAIDEMLTAKAEDLEGIKESYMERGFNLDKFIRNSNFMLMGFALLGKPFVPLVTNRIKEAVYTENYNKAIEDGISTKEAKKIAKEEVKVMKKCFKKGESYYDLKKQEKEANTTNKNKENKDLGLEQEVLSKEVEVSKSDHFDVKFEEEHEKDESKIGLTKGTRTKTMEKAVKLNENKSEIVDISKLVSPTSSEEVYEEFSKEDMDKVSDKKLEIYNKAENEAIKAEELNELHNYFDQDIKDMTEEEFNTCVELENELFNSESKTKEEKSKEENSIDLVS